MLAKNQLTATDHRENGVVALIATETSPGLSASTPAQVILPEQPNGQNQLAGLDESPNLKPMDQGNRDDDSVVLLQALHRWYTPGHGSTADIDLVLTKLYPGLCVSAIRILGDEALAKDVVQDALITVVRKPLSVESVSQFVSFCFVTVRNVALNKWRAGKRNPIVSESNLRYSSDADSQPSVLEQFPDPQPSPAEQVEAEDEIRLIRKLAQELPEKYKKVLELHVIDGLSIDDTAQQLGIARWIVRYRLGKALKQLHKLWKSSTNRRILHHET